MPWPPWPRCPSCGVCHDGDCDPLWRRADIVEVSSLGLDPDRAGVGSSTFEGDMGADGLRIPGAPTAAFLDPVSGALIQTAQQNRYVHRLCGVRVPGGHFCRLLGLRTIITIGQDIVVPQSTTLGASASIFVVERPVVTPFWVFQDGNASFHLRYAARDTGTKRTLQAGEAIFPASTTDWGDVTEPGLVVTPPNPPYRAPAGGALPGVGIGSLGTWRDPTRYPWNSHSARSDLRVDVGPGPGTLSLWATTFQTTPPDFFGRGTGRIVYPSGVVPITDIGALNPEDRFLLQFPQSVYRRVAGAMIVAMIPFGSPEKRGGKTL